MRGRLCSFLVHSARDFEGKMSVQTSPLIIGGCQFLKNKHYASRPLLTTWHSGCLPHTHNQIISRPHRHCVAMQTKSSSAKWPFCGRVYDNPFSTTRQFVFLYYFSFNWMFRLLKQIDWWRIKSIQLVTRYSVLTVSLCFFFTSNIIKLPNSTIHVRNNNVNEMMAASKAQLC